MKMLKSCQLLIKLYHAEVFNLFIVVFYGPLKIKQILFETLSTIMHYVQDIRDGQLK